MRFPLGGDKMDYGVFRIVEDAEGKTLLLQGTPTVAAANLYEMKFESDTLVLNQIEFLQNDKVKSWGVYVLRKE